ncbi:hypothetical protein SEA_KEALII_64 [Arthrobacter phage KeAlii]|uniref:Uncharacterized protein n=1 Tax=Arthrobacter phage KeAlii TaxID=2885973 RepID=A0AA94X086_9CAUD|nr:hypothetical protein PQE15_gp64 [Arthrobacter phage KeAlii]UDL14670.1 hypothetical protein SEA_KEALII_64 [Arthrobacter phage KeAlii]
MPATKTAALTHRDVIEDALGTLATWLPGYDDRDPQHRIRLIEERDRSLVLTYEPRDGEPRKFILGVSLVEVKDGT